MPRPRAHIDSDDEIRTNRSAQAANGTIVMAERSGFGFEKPISLMGDENDLSCRGSSCRRVVAGPRPRNRSRRRVKSRRRVARLHRQRPRVTLAKKRRIPWRWKRARSCPTPAVRIQPHLRCRAVASPWKSARNVRRIPNQSNARLSGSLDDDARCRPARRA